MAYIIYYIAYIGYLQGIYSYIYMSIWPIQPIYTIQPIQLYLYAADMQLYIHVYIAYIAYIYLYIHVYIAYIAYNIYIYTLTQGDLLGCSPLCFSNSPHRCSSLVIDHLLRSCFGYVTGITIRQGQCRNSSTLYSQCTLRFRQHTSPFCDLLPMHSD